MSNPTIIATILSSRKIRKAIREACAAAGNPLTPQAIYAWGGLRSGVPPRRASIVAKVLGISESQVRPDIFPTPPGFVPMPLPATPSDAAKRAQPITAAPNVIPAEQTA